MSSPAVTAITPAKADRRKDGPGMHVRLDVRTPLEHRELHILGSRHLPRDELDAAAFAREHGAAVECIVVCRSRNRASKAATQLAVAELGNMPVIQRGVLARAALPSAVERDYLEDPRIRTQSAGLSLPNDTVFGDPVLDVLVLGGLIQKGRP